MQLCRRWPSMNVLETTADKVDLDVMLGKSGRARLPKTEATAGGGLRPGATAVIRAWPSSTWRRVAGCCPARRTHHQRRLTMSARGHSDVFANGERAEARGTGLSSWAG